MRIERMPSDKALLAGHQRVRRRVVFHRSTRLRPDLLWFDVPEQTAQDLDGSDQAWLLGYLPLAFRLGQPIDLESPVDPTLLENLQRLQEVWSQWFPGLSPVAIRAPEGSPAAAPRPRTACFFTAGIDSFFSVFHSEESRRTEPASMPDVVDDLIAVWGYDIPLSNRGAWERKERSLRQVAEELGKRLVPVATNLRETRLREIPWGLAMHGPALGSVGLLLSARYSRVLLSSSFARGDGDPWGSHALTDRHMSSAQTQFVHYSAGLTRFEKTALVSRHDLALRHLQVCWRNQADTNCGRCEKCVRTLIALELLGRRHHAVTFPETGFNPVDLRDLRLRNAAEFNLLAELVPHALALGRPDVANAIQECLARNPPAAAPERRSRWVRLRNGVLQSLNLRSPIRDTANPA